MRKISVHAICLFALGFAVFTTLLLPACSVNVKKEKDGEEKQVDINTPVGGIHVSKDADVADVGLAVYPGAHLKQKDHHGDDKSANVNISGFGYGLRVVALEYQSDDPPAKVVAFYTDQLRKYGNPLVCHTSHLDINMDMKDSDHGSHELTCAGASWQQHRTESRHQRKPAHRCGRTRRKGIELLAGIRPHSRQGRRYLRVSVEA